MKSEWIGILAALSGVIVGALLNHFLERNRNKAQMLFLARKEVYAKILVGISTSFVPKGSFNAAVSDADFLSRVRMELGELLPQGRLLAEPVLSTALRNLYSCEIELWNQVHQNKPTDALTVRRATLAREIEDLMRIELGVSRPQPTRLKSSHK